MYEVHDGRDVNGLGAHGAIKPFAQATMSAVAGAPATLQALDVQGGRSCQHAQL